MTATVHQLPGRTAHGRFRDPTSVDRAKWVAFGEYTRKNPTVLPFIRKRDPDAYEWVSAGLRTLAVEARSAQWRSPIPGVGGRPEQLIPGTAGSFSSRTDWLTWLLMGGRGSGKSRTGAEAVRELILGRRWTRPPRVALVGQELDSVRIEMVENTLLQVLPPGSVLKWNRNNCEMWLRNGAYLKGYSAERARKLRGPNFHLAWCDELATWKDANVAPSVDSTWSVLKFAVRARDVGWLPRIIATTTPRPVRLLRNPNPDDPINPGPGIHDSDSTVVSSMSTLDNIDNLPAHYLTTVVEPLRGTRLFDQEVLGLLVDAVLGALWAHEDIELMWVPKSWAENQSGGLVRVVVAVDPSVGAGVDGSECGIVVVGLGRDGKAYVLHDGSMMGPPRAWAQRISELYYTFDADYCVAEVNQGYALVSESMGRYAPSIPVKSVAGKRDKRLRAEPVAILSAGAYEANQRVKLAATRSNLRALTTQMTTWDGSGPSPDRLDAMVYGVLECIQPGGVEELVTILRHLTDVSR